MSFVLISLILASLFLYQILEFRKKDILVQPSLYNLVFYREYLFLTMIPYVYYTLDDRYKRHYILSQLSDDVYFLYAAFSAFLFFLLFSLSYKVFLPLFSSFFKRVRADISFKRLSVLMRVAGAICFSLVVISSFQFKTGLFAFLSGIDSSIIGAQRSELSHGGGMLVINKLFMKSWAPMLSYLYLYLYISKAYVFRRMDRFFMFLSVVSGVLASLFFLEKTVLVFYFLGMLGVYVYAGGLLKRYYLLVLFGVSLLLVSLMYLLTYGDRVSGLSYLIDVIIHRTMTQSVGSVMAFDYFSSHEFKGMAGVSSIWASVLGETFSSSYGDIIDYYSPETADISGAMSSFVTGDAYGLFGVVGVLICGVVVAFWYSLFEATKHSQALAIIFVGIYGLYFSHFYVASSFYSFVWPVGLAFNVMPFVVLLLISMRYR